MEFLIHSSHWPFGMLRVVSFFFFFFARTPVRLVGCPDWKEEIASDDCRSDMVKGWSQSVWGTPARHRCPHTYEAANLSAEKRRSLDMEFSGLHLVRSGVVLLTACVVGLCWNYRRSSCFGRETGHQVTRESISNKDDTKFDWQLRQNWLRMASVAAQRITFTVA